jgi:hypothetical protein
MTRSLGIRFVRGRLRHSPIRSAAVVVAAGAACAAALLLGAGEARAAVLPTVRCPVTAGMDGLTFPKWPNRQTVAVPSALAPRLAVYVGGMQRVVAPRGWRCTVQEAVDGSDVMVVTPRVRSSREVRSWSIPACVGCMFDAVCAYVPREAKAVSVGLPCGSRTGGLRVKRLSRTLVEARSARDATVALVFFEPRGDYQRAAGVTCSGEAAICEAVLAEWRRQKR